MSVFTFCPVHGTVLQYQTLPMGLSGALSGNKKARHNPSFFCNGNLTSRVRDSTVASRVCVIPDVLSVVRFHMLHTCVSKARERCRDRMTLHIFLFICICAF